MIVLDASALLELVLDRPSGQRVAQALSAGGEAAAPYLVDAEVGQVLRRYSLRGDLGAAQAGERLGDFLDLPIVRFPHAPLLRRAFDLRDNVTVYDALYLALAEALVCPLMTADAALEAVPGVRTQVEVLGA